MVERIIKGFVQGFTTASVVVLTFSGFHDMIFLTAFPYHEGLWMSVEFLFVFSLLISVLTTIWIKRRGTRFKDITHDVAVASVVPPAQIGLLLWVWNKPVWVVQLIGVGLIIYLMIMWKPFHWWRLWYRMIRYSVNVRKRKKRLGRES